MADNELRKLGAELAALRVTDSFTKHGKGRCKCYVSPPLQPTGTPSPSPDVAPTSS